MRRKYFCMSENPDFWPVRDVKTSHAIAGGFPEPLTEGPSRAPYCSVTPGFAIHGLANLPAPLTRLSLYRSDILSRPAPPSEFIECQSPRVIRSLAVGGRMAPVLPDGWR